MIWLSFDDIVFLHDLIIKKTGGMAGLRDQGLLEAAIAAPLQTFDGEDLFPGEIEKIVRLGFGLASNHAFIDGNKRIGALALQTLLAANQYEFAATNDELSDMFLSIADGSSDENDLSKWIMSHITYKKQRTASGCGKGQLVLPLRNRKNKP